MSRLAWLVLLLAGSAGWAGEVQSGLPIGAFVPAWNPLHVAGPDKGTNACPICTYLERPMIQVFAKDGPQVGLLAQKLEQLVVTHQKAEFKAFLIVVDGQPDVLKKLAEEHKLAYSALCYPDPASKAEDLGKYRIHPDAQNTLVVYKDYKVTACFANVDVKDFARVEEAVRKLLP
jgi:protocatechuate 3,4-dioxygenase, beta subunit